MRTSITLDDDVAALVQQRMRDQGRTLEQVVDDSLRQALGGAGDRRPFSTPVADLGEPSVPLDRALALAGELEDGELLRKLAQRS